MKIALSGTHSTGKTTLMNILISHEKLKNFRFKYGLTRQLIKYGVNINSNGNDVTQAIIITDHWNRSELEGNIFYERCSLDGYVYTKVLHEMGGVSENIFQYAKVMLEQTIKNYGVILYLKPEFDIINDGVRDTNVLFRDKIYKCFEETIKEYNINVIHITGGVKERINQILKVIKND